MFSFFSIGCVENEFDCGGHANECIVDNQKCDGQIQCQNGKDEESCPLDIQKFQMIGKLIKHFRWHISYV